MPSKSEIKKRDKGKTREWKRRSTFQKDRPRGRLQRNYMEKEIVESEEEKRNE